MSDETKKIDDLIEKLQEAVDEADQELKTQAERDDYWYAAGVVLQEFIDRKVKQ